MNALLDQLLGFSDNKPVIVFFIFLRVGAAMALLPVVGERALPQRVRLALTVVFTIIVAPAVLVEFSAPPPAGLAILSVMIAEVIAGLAIGFALRLFVLALQIAGAIAAQSTSLSQIFGGAGTDPQPAIGHMLVTSSFALAVTLGLHVQMASYLIFSYQMFPPGDFIPTIGLSTWGIARVAHAFGLAFSLAAPFVIASLVYNIALGAINRAMPQLMVSFVGAPAITAGGLILLLVSAPIILSAWYSALQVFLGDPAGGSP